MAQVFLDVFYSFGNCMNCFPGSPTLKINSRSFKILRLLGEVRHIPTWPGSVAHTNLEKINS